MPAGEAALDRAARHVVQAEPQRVVCHLYTIARRDLGSRRTLLRFQRRPVLNGVDHRRVRRLLSLAVWALASFGCSGDSGPTSATSPTPTPTPPSESANLNGSWSGPASDSTGPGAMAWQITHTGTAFSGTATMTDTTTGLTGRGSVSGTISGSSVRFTVTVAAGGFDSPFASCTASVTGDAQASASSITGTYTGSSSCGGTIGSGKLTLNKQ